MESYTYDYRGLVLSETNENLGARYYAYDALGRLTQKTDRNERVTTYNYDAVGRLTSEKWLGESDAVLKTFAYTYDAVGNLLTVSDGEHSYSYTYNNLNQNVTTTFNFDAQTAVFDYTYDAVGRQTESSLTLNSTQTRVNQVTYDFLGNATKINQTGSAIDEIFAEFDYNANGLLTSVRRYEVDADDVATSIANSIYEYNANNAVTSITHNNSSGTQIVKHSYTYDSTNNIVEYLNSLDGSTSYDYDFLGQLISADYANVTISDELYTYDSNGNRLTANGSTYTTSTNNELTSDGAYTYTYDDEGNRISKTNSTNTERELYTWDYRNRLTSVTKQTYNAETGTWETTQTIEYTYDYNNVWIRKVIGNEKTIFIPENYQTVIQINNNTVSHHYLWTPNQQDKLLADVTTEDILWALTDHFGTIRDIVGSTTNTHLIYDAFGNLTSGTNPLLFAYTGKAFDTSTSLQNNINRWYDSTVGRWLSTDPIGFEGKDANLYRYVKNLPLVKTDKLGLDIYLETGNNTGNPINDSVHQAVCVDEWDGCGTPNATIIGKRCFSFGKNPGLSGMGIWIGAKWLGYDSLTCCVMTGEVYEPLPVKGATISGRKSTSCWEDEQFLVKMNLMVGTKDGYSVGRHNCRLFSQNIFEDAPGQKIDLNALSLLSKAYSKTPDISIPIPPLMIPDKSTYTGKQFLNDMELREGVSR